MKKLILLLSFFALATTWGCKDKDDNPTTVNTEVVMTFKVLYDGQPLEKYKDYTYDTYKVQFTKFHTYVSELALMKGTEEVLLSEVEWLDFTPSSISGNQAIDVTVKATVPAGEYTGLKIGYGVKKELNAKKPADFAAGHPLNNEGEYWPGWKSYIFNILEGQGDGNNDGVMDIFMVMHCGSDKVYRSYTFDKAISATEATTPIAVELDLKKLFYNNNAWWNLNVNENQYTSNLSSDVRVATFLMDNFDDATTIK